MQFQFFRKFFIGFVLLLLIDLPPKINSEEEPEVQESNDLIREPQESTEDEVTIEIDPNASHPNNIHFLKISKDDQEQEKQSKEYLRQLNVDVENLNTHQVTALTQVFEYPVENFIHSNESNEINESSQKEEAVKVIPKRVKVSCLVGQILTLDALNKEPEVVNSTDPEISSEGSENNTQKEENPEESEDLTSDEPPSVQIVNTTVLLNKILYVNPKIKTRAEPSNCTISFFYTNWCPFSAAAAPHFNAFQRIFPSVKMVGVDLAASGNAGNNYFGIMSVPTIVLFHNGRMISKFNDSSFTLHKFIDFVHQYTDLKSSQSSEKIKINVTSEDFKGPLPSTPTKPTDYNLLLAWIFIIICFFHFLSKSTLWTTSLEALRNTWREAEEHEHEHLD